MRTFSIDERRRLLVQRHELEGGAASAEAVTRSLIALHATDPATVYLSVLARSATSTLADVAEAMYERRILVRWMAMRRTLFVVSTADVPMIQAAVSGPLGARLRRQLVSRILRNGTRPPLEGAPEEWLAEVGAEVERTLHADGPLTGAQLAAAVAGLRVSILPGSASEVVQNLTSPFLTMLGADGRIVRGAPTGPWTSRHHVWEPVDRWWPEGLAEVDEGSAKRDLAERWLARFGPATADDLQWWTGWTKTATKQALDALPVVEVDLHGQPGIALAADVDAPPLPSRAPTAALLPALDPTPMGWKQRAWYLSVEPVQIFDYAGNIGPTVWWGGEAIGSWAVAPDGTVRTVLTVDRGGDARAAVEVAAETLAGRLGGAVVTPAVRTPLERGLGRVVRPSGFHDGEKQ